MIPWLCENALGDAAILSDLNFGRYFPLGLDHSDKSRYSEHANHSADVIGKNREAHLCFDVFEAFSQEVRCAHP